MKDLKPHKASLVIALGILLSVSGCSTPPVRYQPVNPLYLIHCDVPMYETPESIPDPSDPQFKKDFAQSHLCAQKGNLDKAAIREKHL